MIKTIKSDRHYLELAINEAGQLVNKSPKIDGNACHCPFHRDQCQSGSLHQDNRKNKGDPWLFSCHGCPDHGGEWNQLGKKLSNSGDAIAVLQAAAQRAGKPMSLEDACNWLLGAFEQRCGKAQPSGEAFSSARAGPSSEELVRARRETEQAHQILLNGSGLLDRLWNERAIDKPTVKAFQIGYLHNLDGREWWIFPIQHADGNFMVQKRHAADGQDPKSNWSPSGAKTGNPLYPVDLDASGPVFVCPGELKALAGISLGFPAIGVTSGEKNKCLPGQVIKLVTNRQVAIVPDNDDAGRAWAAAVASQLRDAGIECRVLHLGFSAEKEDIGDWLVERRVHQRQDADKVRAELLAAFDAAEAASETPTSDGPPPEPDQEAHTATAWFRTIGEIWADHKTWRPIVRIPSGIQPLDQILSGGFRTGSVHLVVGKAGHGKTQLVAQIATNVARRNTPLGFISLEMTEAELGQLMLAQVSQVPRNDLANGLKPFAGTATAKTLKQAVRAFCSMPVDVVDAAARTSGISRDLLDSMVADGVAQHGWRMVIVDHLGELAPADNDPLHQPLQIDQRNIASLRAIARASDIAMLVVAPLRKAAVFKHPKTAKFAIDDVMGSAALGYAINTCIAVTATNGGPWQGGNVHLQVVKNRNGPTPVEKIELDWMPRCGRICWRGSNGFGVVG